MSGEIVLEAHERLEIRELIEGYHAAINHRDWALLATLFTSDAIWRAEPPVDLRFEGHDQVIKGLQWSVGRQELLVQSCSGVVIRPRSENEADVSSTLVEFGRENAGDGWMAVAFYYDLVAKAGGQWKFRERVLRLQYSTALALPGEVIAAARQFPKAGPLGG